MILGGVGEFLLGNTFPFVVFSSFGMSSTALVSISTASNGSAGAFWLTLGYTLTPIWEVYAAYSPNPATPAAGATAPGFYASFGMEYALRCPHPCPKLNLMI